MSSPGASLAADQARPADPALPPTHGELPPWGIAELPAPPPFTLRNALKVIGPGAIMAATSIGGGEWLVGPAVAVKYSTDVFLIATMAIVLQVMFNLEGIRYTLYTGEPIYGGIMRLKPAPASGRASTPSSASSSSAGLHWRAAPRRRSSAPGWA